MLTPNLGIKNLQFNVNIYYLPSALSPSISLLITSDLGHSGGVLLHSSPSISQSYGKNQVEQPFFS
jgi:hypothetical protein